MKKVLFLSFICLYFSANAQIQKKLDSLIVITASNSNETNSYYNGRHFMRLEEQAGVINIKIPIVSIDSIEIDSIMISYSFNETNPTLIKNLRYYNYEGYYCFPIKYDYNKDEFLPNQLFISKKNDEMNILLELRVVWWSPFNKKETSEQEVACNKPTCIGKFSINSKLHQIYKCDDIFKTRKDSLEYSYKVSGDSLSLFLNAKYPNEYKNVCFEVFSYPSNLSGDSTMNHSLVFPIIDCVPNTTPLASFLSAKKCFVEVREYDTLTIPYTHLSKNDSLLITNEDTLVAVCKISSGFINNNRGMCNYPVEIIPVHAGKGPLYETNVKGDLYIISNFAVIDKPVISSVEIEQNNRIVSQKIISKNLPKQRLVISGSNLNEINCIVDSNVIKNFRKDLNLSGTEKVYYNFEPNCISACNSIEFKFVILNHPTPILNEKIKLNYYEQEAKKLPSEFFNAKVTLKNGKDTVLINSNGTTENNIYYCQRNQLTKNSSFLLTYDDLRLGDCCSQNNYFGIVPLFINVCQNNDSNKNFSPKNSSSNLIPQLGDINWRRNWDKYDVYVTTQSNDTLQHYSIQRTVRNEYRLLFSTEVEPLSFYFDFHKGKWGNLAVFNILQLGTDIFRKEEVRQSSFISNINFYMGWAHRGLLSFGSSNDSIWSSGLKSFQFAISGEVKLNPNNIPNLEIISDWDNCFADLAIGFCWLPLSNKIVATFGININLLGVSKERKPSKKQSKVK